MAQRWTTKTGDELTAEQVTQGPDGRWRRRGTGHPVRGPFTDAPPAEAVTAPTLDPPTQPTAQPTAQEAAPMPSPPPADVVPLPPVQAPEPAPPPEIIGADVIPPPPPPGAIQHGPSSAPSMGPRHPDCHRCRATHPPVCAECQHTVNPPMSPEGATAYAGLYLDGVARAVTLVTTAKAARDPGAAVVPYQEPTEAEIHRAAPVVGLVLQRRFPAIVGAYDDLAALFTITMVAVTTRVANAGQVPVTGAQ